MMKSNFNEDFELPAHVMELLDTYDSNCNYVEKEALELLRNTEISVFNGLRSLNSQQCLKALDLLCSRYHMEKNLLEYIVSLAVLTEYICSAYRNMHFYDTFQGALKNSFKQILFDKLCHKWYMVYSSETFPSFINSKEFETCFKLLKYSVERFPKSFKYLYKLRDTVRRGEEVISTIQQRKSITHLHVEGYHSIKGNKSCPSEHSLPTAKLPAGNLLYHVEKLPNALTVSKLTVEKNCGNHHIPSSLSKVPIIKERNELSNPVKALNIPNGREYPCVPVTASNKFTSTLKNSPCMNSQKSESLTVVDLTKHEEEEGGRPKKKMLINAFDVLMRRKSIPKKVFLPTSPRVM